MNGMKPQEAELLVNIYLFRHLLHDLNPNNAPSVRQVCKRVGSYKQNCYYLDKWSRKGWYEYGVSLDLGWLTDEGKFAAYTLLCLGYGWTHPFNLCIRSHSYD